MNRTEAIKILRETHDTALFSVRTALETLIPELKESEDKRIRNLIYCLIRDRSDNQKLLEHNGVSVDKALAYLERQKEQKPVEPSDEELQRHQDELYDFKVFAAKQAREHHISFVYDFEWNNFCAELLSYFNERQKPAEWKPQPESLEALMYAIEGKWEMIKPTSYLSRMLEELYEGLVNTYNVDESLITELPKTAYSAEDIEELRALKAKIEASMESPITKPAEGTALQKAFMNSKIDYTLEEKCDASEYADAILPTSVFYGENEEEYTLHKIIEAAFIAGQKKEQKPAEKQDYSGL